MTSTTWAKKSCLDKESFIIEEIFMAGILCWSITKISADIARIILKKHT